MRRFFWLVWVLVANSAQAQEPRPLVVPFTLDVKRGPSGFSRKDKDDLQRLLPMLVRAAGGAVPDTARVQSATLELKRQDCDREDACLTQLARLTGALYGLYVSVEYTMSKKVIAAGRIVRDDGVVMAPLQSVELVKEGAFREVARDAVGQLLAQMDLGRLAAVRAVEPAKVVVEPVPPADVPKVEKKVELPLPPPPPPVDVDANKRQVGKVLVVAGGGLAVVGGVLAGVGCAVGCGVQTTSGQSVVPADFERAVAGRNLMTAGFVAAGVGAGVAVLGAVLWGTSAPVQTASLVPVQGGAVVQWGGNF